MTGVVLDAGAFLGLERRVPEMADFFNRARKDKRPLVTSAGVIGQVWRGDKGQTPIAWALRWPNTEVLAFSHADGRAAGRLLAMSGTSDVIDAHVALLARARRWPVITSDPDDMQRLDSTIELWTV